MKPIVILASVTAAVLVGAGIYSVTAEEDSPVGVVTDSTDNPFAGLEEILREEIALPEMTEEDAQAEDEYLGISLAPKPDPAADADAPKSTTENVPYRSCEKDPNVTNRKVFMAGSADASARRAIYAYLILSRVLTTKDCTCAGKVAPFDEVFDVIAEIEDREGPDWNRYTVIDDFNGQASALRAQVRAVCGGDF